MEARDSTYTFQNVRIGAEAELLRLKEQALMGWEKEFRTLKWFGLEDGMKVLEVGRLPKSWFTIYPTAKLRHWILTKRCLIMPSGC